MSEQSPQSAPYSADAQALTELLSGMSLTTGHPLASQIYLILSEQIITLRIKPGQLISEKEIAQVLKASKTPVREALIRLEEVGLVTIVPKSGSYVTPIRINTYIEGCFMRLQLETGAVQRAAERSQQSPHLDRLDEILEQQAEALRIDNYELFFSLDQNLHEAFFLVAGIPGVWGYLQRTQADVNRLRHLKRINRIRRGDKVLAQHKVIVNAIKAQQPDEAKAALITHIGSLESEIEQLASNTEVLTFIENQGTPLGQKRSYRRTGTQSPTPSTLKNA